MKESERILNIKVWDALKRAQERFMKTMSCAHNWQPYGHGYKCTGCEEYTGLHKELNDAIEAELKK